MTEFMTPLKELYAKGTKVWEYANEWNSDPFLDYKEASFVCTFEVEEKVYVVFSKSGEIHINEHEASTGQLIMTKLIISGYNAKFSAVLKNNKLYILYLPTSRTCKLLILDIINYEELSSFVCPDFPNPITSKTISPFAVDEEEAIYICYPQKLQKLVFNNKKIEVIWDIDYPSYKYLQSLVLGDDYLYIQYSKGDSQGNGGILKCKCLDGSLVATAETEIQHLGSLLFQDQDSVYILDGYLDQIKIRGTSTLNTKSFNLTTVNKLTMQRASNVICPGSFRVGFSGFILNKEIYLTKPEYSFASNHVSAVGFQLASLMKVTTDSISEISSPLKGENLLIQADETEVYKSLTLGSREHIYYLNVKDGILRKRKLAKRGVLFNENID